MTLISDKLPKPVIRPGVVAEYICVSYEPSHCLGIGNTPQEAYDDWLDMYRLMTRAGGDAR